jgi:hypothetical protein
VAVRRPLAPGPRVRRFLELSQAGALLGAASGLPALAGGRLPQLVRLGIAACRNTGIVKDQNPRGIVKKLWGGCLRVVIPLPPAPCRSGELPPCRGPPGLVGVLALRSFGRRRRGLWPDLGRWWWCLFPPFWRWRRRSLLSRGRPVLRWRRCSPAQLLRFRGLLALGRRLPDQGAIASLEPPGFAPFGLAAPGRCWLLGLTASFCRGSPGVALLPVFWHRRLLFPFPAGGWTSGSRPPRDCRWNVAGGPA